MLRCIREKQTALSYLKHTHMPVSSTPWRNQAANFILRVLHHRHGHKNIILPQETGTQKMCRNCPGARELLLNQTNSAKSEDLANEDEVSSLFLECSVSKYTVSNGQYQRQCHSFAASRNSMQIFLTCISPRASGMGHRLSGLE